MKVNLLLRHFIVMVLTIVAIAVLASITTDWTNAHQLTWSLIGAGILFVFQTLLYALVKCNEDNPLDIMLDRGFRVVSAIAVFLLIYLS